MLEGRREANACPQQDCFFTRKEPRLTDEETNFC